MKRTHVEPLPASGDRVSGTLLYVRRVLRLSGVHKVEITPKGIEVVREMTAEEEPVVPSGTNDVDMDFLLTNIDMEAYPFDPNEHPIYTLYGATARLTKRGYELYEILVPSWPLFAAWLGVEQTAETPQTVFGSRLLVVPPATTNERVVLLGARAPALFLSDVELGITIDLGV